MTENQESNEDEIIEEEILVGKWDCDQCDTLGNDGDSYDCSACGAPRPEDVKFYLGDSPRLVTDKAGIDSAKAGHDWYCRFCDSGNSNQFATCENCGADKGSARRHKIKITIKEDDDEPVVRIPSVKARREKRPFSKGLIVAAAIAAPVFLCCLSGLFVSAGFLSIDESSNADMRASHKQSRIEYPATLKEHSWKRVVKIEEWRWKKESDWTLPKAGAFELLDKKQEFHHNLNVVDRYETEWYKESYSVKTGQKKVQTGTKTVQDGTKRAKVGTRKVATGTKKVILRYEKVRSGTKRVQTGSRRVKTGREKVVTGRKRVIKSYRTERKTINLGNGRFTRQTKKIPVYGYKNVYGYRDRYRQEPVYENRPAYRQKPIYGDKTIYKDEAVYGQVPKYKEAPVYGMKDVFETRYRRKSREVPIYKKVPVEKTKYYYRVKRWYLLRTERASESNTNPRWPSYTLGEKERVKRKDEAYFLHFEFVRNGESIEQSVRVNREEAWKSYSKSSRYRATRSSSGGSFTFLTE